MGDFVMPSLGADMESGRIVEWRVAPGDEVHRGDVVAVVGTEKSDIDVEVFEDGVVDELLVGIGREVAVGTPLARLRSAGAAPPPTPPTPDTPPPAEPVAPAPVTTTTDDPAQVRSSPRARRLAEERGVDLRSVIGSGPGGAVVAADVERSSAAGAAPTPAAPPRPAPSEAEDRRASQAAATARLMDRSNREIPHYHLVSTIDLSRAEAWRELHNVDRPVAERVLPAALLLKATALAVREVEGFNGFWDDGYQPQDRVDLGVAVSLRGGGLVAPALADADAMEVDDLMDALGGLVRRARAGRLRSSEAIAPTITVTNLGDQGAEEVLGVITPPQVALVGFGRIVERPWAEGGMLGIRPVVRVSLAADHRVTDGHTGSRLLGAIDRLLQHPEEL